MRQQHQVGVALGRVQVTTDGSLVWRVQWMLLVSSDNGHGGIKWKWRQQLQAQGDELNRATVELTGETDWSIQWDKQASEASDATRIATKLRRRLIKHLMVKVRLLILDAKWWLRLRRRRQQHHRLLPVHLLAATSCNLLMFLAEVDDVDVDCG